MSCKKTSTIEPIISQPQATKTYKDSLSFNIDSKAYFFDETNKVGIGNSQINIKPYDSPIIGREYASQTAGKYWYGNADSTMYSSIFGMRSNIMDRATAELYFNKKFKLSELSKSVNAMVPNDQLQIFIIGKQSFAIDFEKENTREGVVLSLNTEGNELSTKKPGFFIYVQSHKMDIQDNSIFEITKVVQVEGNRYLIEATFSLNLYDKEGKLYRVEKGFMRKNINMANNMASFF